MEERKILFVFEVRKEKWCSLRKRKKQKKEERKMAELKKVLKEWKNWKKDIEKTFLELIRENIEIYKRLEKLGKEGEKREENFTEK